MAQSFYVTDITIGRDGNGITYANDGSMVFKDRFVSGVRLVDLLNGNENEGASSISKEVLLTDWVAESQDQVYNRDFWSVTLYYVLIGFNVQLTDINKLRATGHLITSTAPLVTENIEFHEIMIYPDKLKVISSNKVHCYINIEST